LTTLIFYYINTSIYSTSGLLDICTSWTLLHFIFLGIKNWLYFLILKKVRLYLLSLLSLSYPLLFFAWLTWTTIMFLICSTYYSLLDFTLLYFTLDILTSGTPLTFLTLVFLITVNLDILLFLYSEHLNFWTSGLRDTCIIITKLPVVLLFTLVYPLSWG